LNQVYLIKEQKNGLEGNLQAVSLFTAHLKDKA